MRLSAIAAAIAAVATLASAAGHGHRHAGSFSRSLVRPRDHAERDYFAVEFDGAPHASVLATCGLATCADDVEAALPPRLAQYAAAHGLRFEEPLGSLENHYLFSAPKARSGHLQKRMAAAAADEGVLYVEHVRAKRLHKRAAPPMDSGFARIGELRKELAIADPEFDKQWHLYNPLQRHHDINVTGVWEQNVTGQGIVVAIVDDGLDLNSDDLKDNFCRAGSWDFNDPGPEPRPRLADDRHGTRCAGEIAAARNTVCGIGAAYEAKVSGIRILSKEITDADEALSLNYAFDVNDIYSCSWGPPDDGEAMDAPGELIRRALVNGVENGRGGRGSVFVFASGNGAANGDNCNFDGYTNSIYSITVGAIDRKGLHPFYAEDCSAQLVVTYSSGSGDHIHTTDVGKSACTKDHGGTSAAAPLAAGVFALALSVRPELTWRDMQYLALATAVRLDNGDTEWQPTASGKEFSHRYGYGKIDAYALVEAARTWTMVKPQAWYHSLVYVVDKPIPDSDDAVGLSATIEITAETLAKANLARLEHVQVMMNVQHDRRGDLRVRLVSPTGAYSDLATPRPRDDSRDGYDNWSFMSVVHWGESGVGNWTVTVYDTANPATTGVFENWKLTLWGEAIDADKATPYPLPGGPAPSATAPASVSATASATSSVAAAPSATTPSDGDAYDGDGSDGFADDTPTPSHSFLDGLGTLLGSTGAYSAWIYATVLIIIGFVALVAIYICVNRRQAGRYASLGRDGDDTAEGESYEFQELRSAPGDLEAGRDRGERKARELYNAFENIDEFGSVEALDVFDESSREPSLDGEKNRAGPARDEDATEDISDARAGLLPSPAASSGSTPSPRPSRPGSGLR
ncbi:peptidase S8/S53 domain-containing protein [Dipodascopsis tothii]|uniref:peptidase S8/S53 domain-containing protein n=1 Tax=Dipodascopsis tothii TaxID=44089 RepID=UPI0034CFAF91